MCTNDILICNLLLARTKTFFLTIQTTDYRLQTTVAIATLLVGTK